MTLLQCQIVSAKERYYSLYNQLTDNIFLKEKNVTFRMSFYGNGVKYICIEKQIVLEMFSFAKTVLLVIHYL